MSVITAVTAQNSARVAAVHFVPPEIVAAQIVAVLSDYGAAAIKTGFLGRVEIVEVVAERLAYWRGRGLPTRATVVIDPVLVNHRGEAMFGPEVAAAYRELLFPLADLVTPNLAEARLLGLTADGRRPTAAADDGPQTTGRSQRSSGRERETLTDNTLDVVRGLSSVVSGRILVKGARRTPEEIVDAYWDGEQSVELPQPYIDTNNTHGSGDTLSAAICAFRALGHDWPEAIARAQAFTHAAIDRAATWRLGAGHGPLAY
jgi:hydroxymethylpyrimidine/phosphomethylpyrimidine kinase